MAHLDGSDGEYSADVVPLALARLEKMIEARLSQVLPDSEFNQVVRVRVLEQEKDEDLPADPEFYDGLVDRIMESLSEALFEEADATVTEDEDGTIQIRPLSPDHETFAHPGNCDYFVARLRCQHCRKVAPADTSTHCETFLRETPDGSPLAVGDFIGHIDVSQRPDYYQSRRTLEGANLHVLEGWECPCCQRVNWAEVVVRNEHIESIWSVNLSKETLHRAHLISSECVDLAARLSGKQPWQLIDADIVAVLLENL